MDTPSWDRLRIALAVERAGSIRGAARALGINHATVSRHLHDLQARLGVRLFERDGQALVPTVAGADLIATAEQMEEGSRWADGWPGETSGCVAGCGSR
jgi:DNA-binding transcriptional LysR family regulator